MAPVAFTNTAFAQLQLPPSGAPTDVAQVSQNLTQLCGNLGTWTLRVANALNLLIPNGGPVPVKQGGTGRATLTLHGVLIGEGTAAINSTAAGASGIPLIGQGAADPVFGTAIVAGGGTGLTSGTSGGIPYFNAATTMASSAILATNALVTGGGAGAAPVTDSNWILTSHILENNQNAAAIPATISGTSGTQVVYHQVDATGSVISQVAYAAGSNNIGWRAEGTGASPTATGAGVTVLQIAARGFDGTNWTANALAQIQLAAINQTSATDHSGVVNINTVPTGSTVVGNVASFTSQGASIQGSNTNDSAAAGKIGEYASTITLIGAEVSVNNINANVATLSLTAGDWDVWGEVWFDSTTGAATVSGQLNASISTTSATQVTVPADNGSHSQVDAALLTASNKLAVPLATCRISFAATTNVYLVGGGTTSAGTLNAYGKISARRAR